MDFKFKHIYRLINPTIRGGAFKAPLWQKLWCPFQIIFLFIALSFLLTHDSNGFPFFIIFKRETSVNKRKFWEKN